MLVLRHRLAIAGIIAAAAVAVPAAALASGLGSPSGQPSSPQASAAAAAASKSALAASGSGSQSGKPTPPQGPAPSGSKSGLAEPQPSGLPAAASALATRLNVDITAAQRAVKQIVGLIINNGSLDPASSAFAAIAHDLGVSPAQLAAAWDAVSQNVTGL